MERTTPAFRRVRVPVRVKPWVLAVVMVLATLATAPPGGGGGSFQVGGSLTDSDPHGTPVVDLRFALGAP